MTARLVSTTRGFADPATFTADVLYVLAHGFGVRVVGEMQGAVLVQKAWERGRQGEVWFLNDNGGEINGAPVNADAPCGNVSVTAFRVPLDAGTVAYRIHCMLTGRPVDLNARHDDMHHVLYAHVNRYARPVAA